MKKKILKWSAMLLAAVMFATSFTFPINAETTETAPIQTGWVKSGEDMFYLDEAGQKVTGWKTLPNYMDGGKSYQYYFKEDGTLVTDLFQVNYKKYIQKDIKIIVNTKTHNLTLFAKDDKTGKYNIPLKTVVCSTSRDPKGTKAGKNCRLEKTSASRWFIYKKSTPYHYYQWGVKVKHGNFWFHSARYQTTNNRRLETSLYNDMGTDQTTTSVRMQAVNAKLIYDIATKTYKKRRVWVDVIRSNKEQGPFGVYTLKTVNGKIKESVKYDPTDPEIKGNKKIYNYSIMKVQ